MKTSHTKPTPPRLQLVKRTLRNLDEAALKQVAGGDALTRSRTTGNM